MLKPREIGALTIFSYFRRPKVSSPKLAADDDIAIDLQTMGGEINSTYLDIASVSPPGKPEKKTRSRAPDRPPRERAPERLPERQPEREAERDLDRNLDHDSERDLERAERVPTRQPERPPAPQRESRPPPRLRRRSDGNGAAAMDRKGVLSVHTVQKSFVGRMVVKGVSLYVRKGEAVGLLGPNGAG